MEREPHQVGQLANFWGQRGQIVAVQTEPSESRASTYLRGELLKTIGV